MIANPAISAEGFPGSGTGNQGAKRVVQDGLRTPQGGFGPVPNLCTVDGVLFGTAASFVKQGVLSAYGLGLRGDE